MDNCGNLKKSYTKFLKELIKETTVVSPEMLFTPNFQWIKNSLENLPIAEQYLHLIGNLINPHADEIKSTGAMTFREWNGQTTLIIGCGHINTENGANYHNQVFQCSSNHCHDTENEYLIDIDICMIPDKIVEVCHQSLSRCMPIEAMGQIEQIIFEGFCGEETQVLVDDCLKLLANGGMVLIDYGCPVLIKQNDQLYVITGITTEATDSTEATEAHEGIVVLFETVPYKPWTREDVETQSFGFDIFDWKGNFERNGWRFPDLERSALRATDALAFLQSTQ